MPNTIQDQLFSIVKSDSDPKEREKILKQVELLLKEDPALVETVDGEGKLIFYYVQSIEMLELLLLNSVTAVDIQIHNGMIVIGWRSLEISIPDLDTKKLDEINLRVAVYKNDMEKVKKLIKKGVNLNAKGVKGWAINHARSVDMVELLLLKGAIREIYDENIRGLDPKKIEEMRLRVAVHNRDMETVRKLIGEGVDLNAKGLDGKQALDYVKSAMMLEFLLLAGAEDTVPNVVSERPRIDGRIIGPLSLKKLMEIRLRVAVRKNNMEGAKKLIEEGVDLNAKGLDGKQALDYVKSAMMLEFLLLAGAEDTVPNVVSERPRIDGRIIAPLSSKELMEIRLRVAVHKNNMEVAKKLVEEGADPHAKGLEGKTALDYANNDSDKLELERLQLGASTNLNREEMLQKLHKAVRNNNIKESKTLIGKLRKRGVDLNAKGLNGKTVLDYLNSAEMLEELLMLENTPITVKFNSNGELVVNENVVQISNFNDKKLKEMKLRAAVYKNDLETVEELVGKNVSLEVVGLGGKTALSRINSSKMLEKLLMLKGNALIRPRFHVMTGLWINEKKVDIYFFNEKELNEMKLRAAVYRDEIETAKELIKKGVDFNAIGLDNKMAWDYLKSAEMLELLLLNSVTSIDIKIHNEKMVIDGRNLEISILGLDTKKLNEIKLRVAVYRDEIEIAKELIEKGADLHAKGLLDKTALDYVCSIGIVELVMLNNVDLKIINRAGNFYVNEIWIQGLNSKVLDEIRLRVAVHNNAIETAKELIKKGVDFNAIGLDNKTVLDYINSAGMVELLLLESNLVIGIQVNSDGEISINDRRIPNFNAKQLKEIQLRLAVYKDDIKSVEKLIEEGVNLNAEGVKGKPTNYVRSVDMAELLLLKDATGEIYNENIRGLDSKKIEEMRLRVAVYKNDMETAKKLIERGVNLYAKGLWDKTALDYAKDDSYKLELLWLKVPTDSDREILSRLYKAISGNNIELVKEILSSVDLDKAVYLLNAVNYSDGKRALDYVKLTGMLEFLLLAGAEDTVQVKIIFSSGTADEPPRVVSERPQIDGRTIRTLDLKKLREIRLRVAVHKNDVETVRKLIKKGVDLYVKGLDAKQALNYINSAEMLELFLLQKVGIDIGNFKGKMYLSGIEIKWLSIDLLTEINLRVAVFHNEIKKVEALITAGGIDIDSKGLDGKKASDYIQSPEMLELLLLSNAEDTVVISKEDGLLRIDGRVIPGLSLGKLNEIRLRAAVRLDKQTMVEELIAMEVVDVNAEGLDGKKALDYIQSPEMMEVLLSAEGIMDTVVASSEGVLLIDGRKVPGLDFAKLQEIRSRVAAKKSELSKIKEQIVEAVDDEQASPPKRIKLSCESGDSGNRKKRGVKNCVTRTENDKVHVEIQGSEGKVEKQIAFDGRHIEEISNYEQSEASLVISFKAEKDKTYTLISEADESETQARYYVVVENYQISLDSLIDAAGLTAETKQTIHDHLNKLRDNQLVAMEQFALKECLENISQLEIPDEEFNKIQGEIKQRFRELGVKAHTIDGLMEKLSESVQMMALDVVNDLAQDLSKAGMPVDTQGLQGGKNKLAKGSRIFTSLVIIDLVQGIQDVKDVNAFKRKGWIKQVFTANAIVDTLNDMRVSLGATSHNPRWKFLKSVPKPVRVFMVTCLDNPIVRSVLFFTLATSFSEVLEAIRNGKNTPENYLVLSSITSKLLGMTITKPLQIVVNRLSLSLSQGALHRLSTKLMMRLGKVALGAFVKRLLIPSNKLFMFVDLGILLYQYLERGSALARELPLYSNEAFLASFDNDRAAKYQDDILIKNYLLPIKNMAYHHFHISANPYDGLVYYLPIYREFNYDEIIGKPIFTTNAFGLSTGAEDFEDCALVERPRIDTPSMTRDFIVNGWEEEYYFVDLSQEDIFRELRHEYNDEGFYLGTAFFSRSNRSEFYKLDTEEKRQAYVNKKLRYTHGRINQLSPDFKRKYFPTIDIVKFLQGLEYSGWKGGPSSWKVSQFCGAPQVDKKYYYGEVVNRFGRMQGPVCFLDQIYRSCTRIFFMDRHNRGKHEIKPLVFINGFRIQFLNEQRHILYLNPPLDFVAVEAALATIILKGGYTRVSGAKADTFFILNAPATGKLTAKGENNTLYLNYNATGNLRVSLVLDCDVQPSSIKEYLPSGEVKNLYLFGDAQFNRFGGVFNRFISRVGSQLSIRTDSTTRYVDMGSSPQGNTIETCVPPQGFQEDDVEVRILHPRNRYTRNQKRTIYLWNGNHKDQKITENDRIYLKSDQLVEPTLAKKNVDLISLDVDHFYRFSIDKVNPTGSYVLTSYRQGKLAPSIDLDSFRYLRLLVNFEVRGLTARLSVYEKPFHRWIEDAGYQRENAISGVKLDPLIEAASQSHLEGRIQATESCSTAYSSGSKTRVNACLYNMLDMEKIARTIGGNYPLDIPLSRLEVKQFFANGYLSNKVVIGGLYSDTIDIDFNEKQSDAHSPPVAEPLDNVFRKVNIVVEGGKGELQYKFLALSPDFYRDRSQNHASELCLTLRGYQPENRLDFRAMNNDSKLYFDPAGSKPGVLKMELVLPNKGYPVVSPQDKVVIFVVIHYNEINPEISFIDQTTAYRLNAKTFRVERVESVEQTQKVLNHPADVVVAHHQMGSIEHDESVIRINHREEGSLQEDSLLSKIPGYAWGILGGVGAAVAGMAVRLQIARRFLPQGNNQAVRSGAEVIALTEIASLPAVVNMQEVQKRTTIERDTAEEKRKSDEYDNGLEYVDEIKESKANKLPFENLGSSGYDANKTGKAILGTPQEENAGPTWGNSFFTHHCLEVEGNASLQFVVWLLGCYKKEPNPVLTLKESKENGFSNGLIMTNANVLAAEFEKRIKSCAQRTGIAYSAIEREEKNYFSLGRKLREVMEGGWKVEKISSILTDDTLALKVGGLSDDQKGRFYTEVKKEIEDLLDKASGLILSKKSLTFLNETSSQKISKRDRKGSGKKAVNDRRLISSRRGAVSPENRIRAVTTFFGGNQPLATCLKPEIHTPEIAGFLR